MGSHKLAHLPRVTIKLQFSSLVRPGLLKLRPGHKPSTSTSSSVSSNFSRPPTQVAPGLQAPVPLACLAPPSQERNSKVLQPWDLTASPTPTCRPASRHQEPFAFKNTEASGALGAYPGKRRCQELQRRPPSPCRTPLLGQASGTTCPTRQAEPTNIMANNGQLALTTPTGSMSRAAATSQSSAAFT